MDGGTGTYLAVLVMGTILTLIVGQILLRVGKPYFREIFGDPQVANGYNRLISVLFHLVVLGILAIISTIDIPADGTVQLVVTKMGIVLLVLAGAHGATLWGLNRYQNRRREQELADEVSAQVERARRGQPNGYQGPSQGSQYPAAPRAASGQVIEPWSPR